MKWKSLWFVHKEFSYESPGERILKIGPHLPKLLSNSKWLTLWGHSVLIAMMCREKVIIFILMSASKHSRIDNLAFEAAYCTDFAQKLYKHWCWCVGDACAELQSGIGVRDVLSSVWVQRGFINDHCPSSLCGRHQRNWFGNQRTSASIQPTTTVLLQSTQPRKVVDKISDRQYSLWFLSL